MSSASITVTFKIRFIKGNVNGMPSILTQTRSQLILPYDFDLKNNPTFFDLWSRCPSMMLVPVGETKPYVEFDTPLISMPTHIFDAYDWTEGYMEHYYELKTRMCAVIKEQLYKQREATEKELERLNNRIKSLSDYEATLVRDESVYDVRFPFM